MTLHLTNPTRRLIVTLLAVFSMVVAALPTAFIGPAFAVSPSPGFEIDGNYDGAADWRGVSSSALTTINEPTPDIIYGDGNPDGKESGYPDGWTFQEGVANPSKNDLTVGYLHSKTHDDRQWLMIAVERAEATGGGDTDVLVEFNQSDWTGSGTAITPGGRTEGDLLVQFDLKGQNAVNPTLVASRWTGTAWSPVGVTYFSAINSGQITNLRDQTIAPGTFGEVALDLTAVYESQTDPCVTFGSMFARTQSSGGDQDPQLTDILGPENGLVLSTCGTITVKKEDAAAPGSGLEGATFALYENDGDDSFEPDGDDGPAIDACDTGTDGTCGFTDIEPAPTEYWIEETVAPAGYLLSPDTVHGPFSITSRQDYVVPAGTFSNPRIPYQVLLSPNSTNHVSTSHTFTVTLQQDLGDGWGAVPGANLTPSWTEGTATGSSITSEDCTAGTNSAGQCSVTVYSDDEGTGSLNATFTAPYQTDVPVTFEAATPTTKTWASYTLTVGDDGINLVDHAHTFTVELRRDTGSGPLPYGGQTVNLKWTDVDASVTNDTCTTDTNGECTYTVNSSTTGVGTLEASYASTHDEGTVTYTTDPDATKRWVYYELDVSDDSVNEVGTSHTFTVTLERDWGDGNGLVTHGGQTLDLDWAGPEGSTAPSECLTDSSGVCEVEVFSPITGTGLLTAHYTTTLDSGEHTFDSPSAEKQWIDYAIEVTPETADNLLGFDHVFTVSLTEDTGSGFGPAVGELVSLDWDGPEGSEADADSCVTDEAGTCDVTVSSPITGSGTLTASFDTEVDSGTISRTGTGTKTWVDYAIDVDPDRAVNPVGTTHTFTVSLERIHDGVTSAAAGEPVSLGITGPGEIIEVPGGSFDTDGRTGTCTTDPNGQCTVTIASDEVGDTTLSAMYAAEVGETSATFSDSGLKLWRSDPAIELVKNAEIEPTADGLKVISCNSTGCPETTFTFTVTNVGGVALSDATVTDDKFGPITLADTELEVGGSTTGTATYTPSRQEIDAGFHRNLGTATGVSPDGQTVEDTDPERVEIIEVLPNVIERPEPAPEPAPEPEPEPLPTTGTDAAWMSLTALLALLLGWSMVWLGRRREIEDRA